MLRKISLYANTIKYLKPSQLCCRAFHRFLPVKRTVRYETAKAPVSVFIPELDLDEAYLSRFDCEALLKDELLLLNERHKADFTNWSVSGKTTHLWLFSLHYMEYLIPLAVRWRVSKDEAYYRKVREIVLGWIKCFEKEGGDAWNAYTISERLPNWLITMELLEERLSGDGAFREKIEKSMYCQYKHLQSNQEKHLLGNHYFENLKTMIIAAVLFDDRRNLEKYLKNFDGQIREQIPEDGMHYERSFMYHKIIMEDILRVLAALKQVQGYGDKVKSYAAVLGKMLGCTLSFEGRIRRVPLFNDAGNNVAKPVPALEAAVRRILPETYTVREDIKELPDAGYYKYESEDAACIIDCGKIGPAYIPGHGHCDCLSYELYVNGEPFLVNSGTYQYQSSKRSYFRSTRAHNCFTVNGFEQSQCWGEHRVAKRISKIKAVREDNVFSGQCRFWNGIKASRKFRFFRNHVIVEDKCDCRGDAVIRSYVHLAPDVEVLKRNEKNVLLRSREQDREMTLEMLEGENLVIHAKDDICWYSDEFGRIQKTNVLEITGNRVAYKIQWGIKKW